MTFALSMTLALPGLTVLSLLCGYLLMTVVVHRAYRAPRIVEVGTPADFGLPFRTVSIPTANDRHLFAWYVPAPEQSERAPGVVAIHGWGGNAEFMLPFAVQLHRAGYATVLVDARNHGCSDADTFSSLPRFAEDLEHGFEWLAGLPEVDPHRLALLGHSVGAAAALLVASRRTDVAAVVSIAAFAHPEELMRRQMQAHLIPYVPLGWAVLRYIEHTIGIRYEAIAPVNTIRNVHCPVLLVHGSKDRSVPAADVEAIFAQRAHRRVELLTLPEAGHDSVEHIERHWEDLTIFLQGALQDEPRGL
jgi:dipeptidyl aminopeptidase/acylaminoacyl peptidase